jgi:hypothetical protein
MEVTELQTNDTLKNAFEPSDLGILKYPDSFLKSEVFPKIWKLAAGMMTVLYLRENILSFIVRNNKFCSKLIDEREPR